MKKTTRLVLFLIVLLLFPIAYAAVIDSMESNLSANMKYAIALSTMLACTACVVGALKTFFDFDPPVN